MLETTGETHKPLEIGFLIYFSLQANCPYEIKIEWGFCCCYFRNQKSMSLWFFKVTLNVNVWESHMAEGSDTKSQDSLAAITSFDPPWLYSVHLCLPNWIFVSSCGSCDGWQCMLDQNAGSRQSFTLHPFPFGSSMHTLPGSLCITGFHPWAAYPSSTGSWLWWVHGRRQEGGKRTAGMSPASAVSVSPQQMSLDASQHLTLPPL